MGLGVRIELENSLTALERLGDELLIAAQTGEIRTRFAGETATSVRAIKAALDKLVNTSWTRLTGRRNDRLFFPIAQTSEKFDGIVNDRMPEAPPALVEALRRYQPFTEPTPLRYLPGLYATEAHHTFTLKETRDVRMSIHAHDGVPFFQTSERGFRLGVPEFLGAPADAVTTTEGPTTSISGVFRDVWFVKPHVSVAGTLMDMHNVVLRAFLDVAPIAGLDLVGDEMETFRISATYT